jgi:hypothetical protein
VSALAEAEKRDQQRQRVWASIIQALEDDSMAVFRAMRRFRSESVPEQVERVLTSFEDGRFLIDRMGAQCTVDQDLAVVLLDPRQRLQAEHGNEGHRIRGLSVEEPLSHLREGLLPLAERCGEVMREALAALEAVRARPNPAVERSAPVRIAVTLGPG